MRALFYTPQRARFSSFVGFRCVLCQGCRRSTWFGSSSWRHGESVLWLLLFVGFEEDQAFLIVRWGRAYVAFPVIFVTEWCAVGVPQIRNDWVAETFTRCFTHTCVMIWLSRMQYIHVLLPIFLRPFCHIIPLPPVADAAFGLEVHDEPGQRVRMTPGVSIPHVVVCELLRKLFSVRGHERFHVCASCTSHVNTNGYRSKPTVSHTDHSCPRCDAWDCCRRNRVENDRPWECRGTTEHSFSRTRAGICLLVHRLCHLACWPALVWSRWTGWIQSRRF